MQKRAAALDGVSGAGAGASAKGFEVLLPILRVRFALGSLKEEILAAACLSGNRGHAHPG